MEAEWPVMDVICILLILVLFGFLWYDFGIFVALGAALALIVFMVYLYFWGGSDPLTG